ncbi:MAG: S8 family peptidase [Terriglobales bacterium]
MLSQSTASVLNPVISTIDQSTASVLNGETNYYGTRAPKQYVQQPMVAQVAAGEEAHALATGRGAVVAIIDNGVAQFNPVLSKVLLYREGYNFYDNSPNWSAWSDLEQSTASVLNQSTASVLNSSSTPVLDQSTASVLNGCLDQSTASVLNQSTASVLNQSTASVLNSAAEKFLKQLIGYIISNCEPDFGHGTAVAGMIHLVAPEAKILPIKAFGPDGTAPASAIYQSITYAIDHGANVINMSFSAQSLPQDVQNAVQEAVGDGIIIAAAAGNYGYGASPTGTDDPVVPAALPGVMGAGAVDDCQAATNPPPAAGTVNPCSPDPTPTLALFSNFDPPTGNVDAQVGAPGVQLYSTFPGFGLIWATVSGTSFSAPVVAGEAALLVQLKQTGAANRNLIETSADGAVLGGPLGYGLVQVLGALRLAPAPSGGSGKGHHHKKH